MSAFVVDNAHIDYLVSAAIQYERDATIRFAGERVDTFNATEIGARLLAENIASVSHRYPNETLDELTGGTGAIDYRHRFVLNIKPVWVLKAIRCYEYQSCEHPGWQDSAAKAFCDDLRGAAIGHLPGMDAAPWEITSEHVSGAQAVRLI